MILTHLKRVLSFILCAVLVAAMALCIAGCSDNKNDDTSSSVSTSGSSQVASSEAEVIGQGSKSFSLTVTDLDGNQTHFTVKTDKETVGEALLENKLIEGEQGDYGLYIKKVNGITADYDKDQTYWAFYIDGEYALTGVDTTKIADNAKYELKVEK